MAKLTINVEVQTYGEDEEEVLTKLRDTIVQVVSIADLSVGTFCTSSIENHVEVYDQEVPSYGSLMSVYEFASAVANGSFIDYDGFAHPVKDLNGVLKAGRTNVNPSDIEKTLPSDATHVVWFNK